ncbi:hypothetical protein AY601_1851 [Pedobacter cryoconitis]|uniref:HTH marR-type domain-containing protein n=1 Tax=Pedobacter cryoconitis TaxID=188932 RepID=A0A127VC17_9SPHI|nr:hypothetical protein AY601_1851 [Pedobacter cryoconitis]
MIIVKMMVSKVLRTLEGKNFITRQEHPTDNLATVTSLLQLKLYLRGKGLYICDTRLSIYGL